MKKTIPALVGAAALMVGGVGFAKGESQTQKDEQACTKFQKFQSSVQSSQNMGPNSTVGQLKTASADVEKNFKEFEKAATKAAKPEVENVKKSVKELRADAQKIPSSATISEAQARLQPDIQQVKMASNQLMTKLNCGMGGAGQQGMGEEQQGMEQQGTSGQGSMGGSQQGMEQPSTSGQGSTGGSSQQGMGGSQSPSDQGMNQGSTGGSQGSSGQDQSGQGSGY